MTGVFHSSKRWHRSVGLALLVAGVFVLLVRQVPARADTAVGTDTSGSVSDLVAGQVATVTDQVAQTVSGDPAPSPAPSPDAGLPTGPNPSPLPQPSLPPVPSAIPTPAPALPAAPIPLPIADQPSGTASGGPAGGHSAADVGVKSVAVDSGHVGRFTPASGGSALDAPSHSLVQTFQGPYQSGGVMNAPAEGPGAIIRALTSPAMLESPVETSSPYSSNGATTTGVGAGGSPQLAVAIALMFLGLALVATGFIKGSSAAGLALGKVKRYY